MIRKIGNLVHALARSMHFELIVMALAVTVMFGVISGCGRTGRSVAPRPEVGANDQAPKAEPIGLAAPEYSTSAAMLAVIRDGSNYTTDTARGIRYFKWSPNGPRFDRSGFTPSAFRMSGMPVNGTRVDEDASRWRFQCAALVKAKTGAPVTSAWRAGGRVVDGSGVAGSGVAIFDGSGVYTGTHACILLSRNSDGSITVLEQNVPIGYGIRTRVIVRTNRGGINDAASYRVIL